jgi:hypothetical protein
MCMAKYPIAHLLVTLPCSERLECITAKALTHSVIFVHRMTCVFERWSVMSEYDDLLVRIRVSNVSK